MEPTASFNWHGLLLELQDAILAELPFGDRKKMIDIVGFERNPNAITEPDGLPLVLAPGLSFVDDKRE